MKLPQSILDKLLPHQPKAAQHLLDLLGHRDHILDGSETGTGKTFVTAAILAAKPLPTLVVCPKIVVTPWKQAAAHFGDTVSAGGIEMIRTGRTPFGRWQNQPPPGYMAERTFKCQCCQREVNLDNLYPCQNHHLGIHCLIPRKKEWNYGEFIWNRAVKRIVFDEAHRMGGINTLNGRMLINARRQGIQTISLTATPACSPLNLWGLGELLDLHRGGPDFYSWARKHGCGKLPGMQGFRWLLGPERQNEVMRAIHEELFPKRGVCVRTSDIPGFPERIVTADCYDIENPNVVNRLYEEMADAMAELEERHSKYADPDGPLQRILIIRSKLEMLKIPVADELARDLMAKGYSVVFFVNFRQTVDELCARFRTTCLIDGRQTGNPKARQKCIDEFQTNRSRVMVANSEAGGVAVSLQDLDGRHPRAGVIFPMHKVTSFKQVLGRLPRVTGKSAAVYKILLAAGTYEETMRKTLVQRVNALDTLLTGDLFPDFMRTSKLSTFELLNKAA